MKVLVTHPIPAVGLSILRGHSIELDVLTKKKVKKGDIISALRTGGYDGMITLLTDAIDAEVLGVAGSGLRVIANYAVGYNNIDVQGAYEKGIVVTNTPGVLTQTVAEHAFGLILAVATRVVEADAFVRAGRFTGWEPELLLGVDLFGKTISIVGAGRIGFRVAEIAGAFGMRVLYYDMQANENLEKRVGATRCMNPEDALKGADVVSLHLPLTADTHHFMDFRRLSLMRDDAILVNTSRGAIVDEQALIRVLQERKLFGAALDVFENEPAVPRALRVLDNVILTPHTASASVGTRNKMAKMVAEDVIAVLHGGKPLHAVR